MTPLILQYWHNEPPGEVRELMEGWKAEEGFCYKLFDDAAALAFIDEHFDDRTRSAYLSCAVPAMKSDVIRLCVLLVQPGIYVDADIRRHSAVDTPLMPLYRRLKRGLLYKKDFPSRPPRITNSFIAVTEPGDRLLQVLLETAVDNIERRISNSVWEVTGPGIATQLFRDLGHGHELFRGFELWNYEALGLYMRHMSKLSYKSTEDHWVLAQAARSIFTSQKPE
jgi:mannosyltransferase OCH1-like enzyme